MKKRIILVLMCVVLCLSNTSAVYAKYYNQYEDDYNCKGTDYKCSSMQGMCMDRKNNKVYYAKIDNKGNAILYRFDLKQKKNVIMKYVSGNKKQSVVTILHHANDMEFVRIGKKSYLYVAVKNSKTSYDIIKLKLRT